MFLNMAEQAKLVFMRVSRDRKCHVRNVKFGMNQVLNFDRNVENEHPCGFILLLSIYLYMFVHFVYKNRKRESR
jgi:hypothetical protein